MKIASVTVLEDRASVTRRGTVPVPAGQHRVVIEGVSPVIADKTLTATATGARVLDARVERFVAPWREGALGHVTELREERAEIEVKRLEAEARAAAARAESAALESLVAGALHDLAVAATRGASESAVAAQLAELDAQDRVARTRAAEADADAAVLAVAKGRLDIRVARAEAEVGTTAARLVLDLVAEAPGEATVTVGYVVPCAAWRPYHRAVLQREDARVEWETTACVWQATGEDWVDCALVFSLERASLGVDPPDLVDDELRSRRRPDVVTVEARDHEVQTTGLGGGAAEVPGIDDGGLGLTLASEGVATVQADGAPHRVVVHRFTSAAQIALVAIPLRSPWVHVRARFSNGGTIPLLAGPVDLVMASGYVGRGEVGFVARGERVDLGFGPDAELRVHRTETREREEAGLLGSWNVQTVKVAVRLSNLGAKRREVVVTERVPVSEIEQVEIETAPGDGPRDIDDKGLVSWTVELAGHGRGSVALEYAIKSKPGVAGV